MIGSQSLSIRQQSLTSALQNKNANTPICKCEGQVKTNWSGPDYNSRGVMPDKVR